MALAVPFPAASSQLRLTRRGKAVVAVAAALVALGAMALGGHSTAGASADTSGQAAGSSIVVKPGENLWQIAKRVAPGSDPRATVLRLREINGLSDSVVVAGQALVVPVS